ncbi:hypothetical protein [Aureivirga sp. CE67]|uniref:hypothetical protein n=1 Tax=Aureivirga sp. CE67 TaxID=1788983 RepID=UPI0018C9DC5C|nr:hypothetical protein [Aureivirga sp. CE67]
MRLTLLLLFTMVTFSLQAQGTKYEDKIMHYGAGNFVAASTSVFYNMITPKEKRSKIWKSVFCLASATLVGLGKELYDKSAPNGQFDVKDLGATMLGGLTIVIVIN